MLSLLSTYATTCTLWRNPYISCKNEFHRLQLRVRLYGVITRHCYELCSCFTKKSIQANGVCMRARVYACVHACVHAALKIPDRLVDDQGTTFTSKERRCFKTKRFRKIINQATMMTTQLALSYIISLPVA